MPENEVVEVVAVQELTTVYVLTNPAMPDLIKIGRTDGDVTGRLGQLYTTGVPVPFECHYACRVATDKDWEKRLHTAFGNTRVNPRREFFKMDPECVKVILEGLAEEDVTPTVRAELAEESDELDKASGERLKRSRRPNMNFHDMGLPNGSTLRWRDGDQEVTVVGPRKVEYQGTEVSLTRVTTDLLGREYSVAPGSYWLYGERLLTDIYNETYESED